MLEAPTVVTHTTFTQPTPSKKTASTAKESNATEQKNNTATTMSMKEEKKQLIKDPVASTSFNQKIFFVVLVILLIFAWFIQRAIFKKLRSNMMEIQKAAEAKKQAMEEGGNTQAEDSTQKPS